MENDEQETITYVDTTNVFCDGGRGELGHPGVYLNIGEQPKIVCPYCSQIFALVVGSPNEIIDGSEH
jgi:uncharacterized Zn-finger protein